MRPSSWSSGEPLSDLDVSLPTGAGVATYPPGATFGPRQMRDWEFVWLLEGDAEYRWGEAVVAAPEGSVVLCRPGETDSFRWDPHKRTRHGFFHFQVQNAPDDCSDWPLVRGSEDDDVLRPLFQHVLTWFGRGDSEQTRLTMLTMLAAFRTGERGIGDVGREAWPPAVERVCTFIADSLDADPAASLPLPVLAGVACVTPEHLCRLFTATLGRSPAATVRLARLDRAAVLLARSNYTVGEVAALYGFVSPFHFSRAFKQALGQSPSEVRRRLGTGSLPLSPLAHTLSR